MVWVYGCSMSLNLLRSFFEIFFVGSLMATTEPERPALCLLETAPGAAADGLNAASPLFARRRDARAFMSAGLSAVCTLRAWPAQANQARARTAVRNAMVLEETKERHNVEELG
mmetsp:Transcript_162935/g.312965  ORF Transcript_162935/g.312965 Transcript_162935/m.312965 type:complete len:114 (-) Transcript_162935:61-402(-)